MSAKLRAHLAALTVNLIYGANFSIAKQVMPEFIRPFGFIVLRVLPAALLFFLASLLVREKKIEAGDKWKLIACALFGVAINQLLFFKGLSLTHPINGALIMTTNPVLVLLLATIFLNEKISVNKIAGIVLALAGAATLILFGKKFAADDTTVLGDTLIFINSLSFAIFIIIVKPMMVKYHAITITKWVFVFGSFMVLPFGYNEFAAIAWHTFDYKIWLCVLFVVIGVTFVAYALNIYALRELNASTVSAYIYLQPVFTTIIAWMVLKATPNLLHGVAAALIFIGVYLVSKSKVAVSDAVK